MLRPWFDTRNAILFEARNSDRCDESLKLKCKESKKNVHDEVQIVKTRWVNDLANKIHNMRFSPKVAWKHIKLLRDGFTAYHSISKLMIFQQPNGSITSFDKEVITVLIEHFIKVYNYMVSID